MGRTDAGTLAGMEIGLTQQVLALAKDRGAATAGIAAVDVFEDERLALKRAVRSGRSGPLHFTHDDPDTATDIQRSLPWAKSLVVLATGYAGEAPRPADTGPVVGRFATLDHYEGLRAAANAVAESLRTAGYRAETLIDDNRLVDRGAAARAGIGWWGKSTMILTPGHGPWILLGSVATDARLDVTPPMTRGCGSCVACIPACPTGALDERGLDARRCLSTWLQSRGSIPHWIRPRLGRRISGCDDCLVACPPGLPALRRSGADQTDLSFADLLAIDDDDLTSRFHWWYVPKGDGRYLRRNLLVAAGNSGEGATWPHLSEHLTHRSSMIRGVAAWAHARSGDPGAPEGIAGRLALETSPETRDELKLAGLMLEDADAYEEVIRADEWAATAPGVDGLALLPSDRKDAGTLLALGETAVMSDVVRTVDIDWWRDLDEDSLSQMIIVHDPERSLEGLRRASLNAQRARSDTRGLASAEEV